MSTIAIELIVMTIVFGCMGMDALRELRKIRQALERK